MRGVPSFRLDISLSAAASCLGSLRAGRCHTPEYRGDRKGEKDKKKTNLLKNFKSESEATGGGRAVGPVAREVDGETLTQRNSVAVDAVIRTL